MFNIRDFLKRIQGIQTQEYALRVIIKESIKKHTSLDVPIESITIKSHTVVLKNISSIGKSALFIKKAAVIKDINTAQSVHFIYDIR